MGCNARAVLFFGVVLKPDAVPAYREGGEETGPAWLAYAGKREGSISVFATGHHDVPRLAVALAPTVHKGKDWGAVKIGRELPIMGLGDAEEVDAFLGKYNLRAEVETGTPQWLAVPYYG